ncbi:MAG: hypothetical protein KDA24_07745 [Deltaproteobacteria bacterium]|nr:hypothetical protein [Deltaproteobacteria bacterium]
MRSRLGSGQPWSPACVSGPLLQLSAVLKDFKEDDSGLEYFGAGNQQMGDGGYIAQITDRDPGEVVAVSNADWRCLVIHEAPLNKECESSSNPSVDCQSSISDEPDG